jgi:hypothetical protein
MAPLESVALTLPSTHHVVPTQLALDHPGEPGLSTYPTRCHLSVLPRRGWNYIPPPAPTHAAKTSRPPPPGTACVATRCVRSSPTRLAPSTLPCPVLRPSTARQLSACCHPESHDPSPWSDSEPDRPPQPCGCGEPSAPHVLPHEMGTAVRDMATTRKSSWPSGISLCLRNDSCFDPDLSLLPVTAVTSGSPFDIPADAFRE